MSLCCLQPLSLALALSLSLSLSRACRAAAVLNPQCWNVWSRSMPVLALAGFVRGFVCETHTLSIFLLTIASSSYYNSHLGLELLWASESLLMIITQLQLSGQVKLLYVLFLLKLELLGLLCIILLYTHLLHWHAPPQCGQFKCWLYMISHSFVEMFVSVNQEWHVRWIRDFNRLFNRYSNGTGSFVLSWLYIQPVVFHQNDLWLKCSEQQLFFSYILSSVKFDHHFWILLIFAGVWRWSAMGGRAALPAMHLTAQARFVGYFVLCFFIYFWTI